MEVIQLNSTALALASSPRDDEKFVVDLKLVEQKRLEIMNNWSGGSLSAKMGYQMAKLSIAYGLDPFLGELICLGDKPYPTVAALQRKANENEHFDGEICRPATQAERIEFYYPMEPPSNEYLWRCEVHVKNRKLPFVGWGRASKENVKMSTMQVWLPEMAQKRARGRTYRLVFNIGIPTVEEMYEFEDGTKMVATEGEIRLASPEMIERIEREVLTQENLEKHYVLQNEYDGLMEALQSQVTYARAEKTIEFFLGEKGVIAQRKLVNN